MSHLQEVRMTYWQHFRRVMKISFSLSLAVIVLVIHAFVPCLFEKTGSDIIRRIHESIK